MRKPLLLTLLALLVGCTAPSVPESPRKVYREAPAPPLSTTAPAVIPRDGGWMIRHVDPSSYLWREDGEAIAFRNGDGLWSASADGKRVDLVAAGDLSRDLLRYQSDGLIYIEKGPEGIFLRQGARSVAQLAPAGAPEALWRLLVGDRLVFALPGKGLSVVDLVGGAVKSFGGEPVDVVRGEFAASSDGRYLSYKLGNRGDALRVIDLQTGLTPVISGEAHLPGAAWAPVAAVWAVRAAEPGSGLPRAVGANLEEGATHVDVGTPDGALRHLRPPGRVNLTAGPWWSPDGKRLALMGEPPEGEPGPIWIVEVATGAWKRLQPAEPFWVTGWTPDGRHLTSQSSGGLLPVDGGALIQRPELLERVTLPDGSSVELLQDGTVLHRGVTLLPPEPGLRERLSVAGRHGALLMTRAGEPTDLVVFALR